MSTLRRSSALAAILAGLLALTACDPDQGDEADGGGAPADPAADEKPPTADEGPDEVEDSDEPEQTKQPDMDFPEEDAELVDGMTRERSVGWEDYEAVSATQLRFLATSGNQSCYGQRSQVEESEDEVAVAVIVGQRDGAPEICTQEAVFVAVPVELEEPVGEREVVELQNPELND